MIPTGMQIEHWPAGVSWDGRPILLTAGPPGRPLPRANRWWRAWRRPRR